MRREAVENGLDPVAFVRVAKCESANFKDHKIQSGHVRNGKQENSWGIWQFNLDANPQITKEQAQDPIWATEEAVKWWKAGQKDKWSCK